MLTSASIVTDFGSVDSKKSAKETEFNVVMPSIDKL